MRRGALQERSDIYKLIAKRRKLLQISAKRKN